jgi:hypothetical protein
MGFLASPVKISLFGSLSQPLPLALFGSFLLRERERGSSLNQFVHQSKIVK